MNELIGINYETEEPTVSARDLHEKLNIGTEFAKWFTRMCEYGFSQSSDYTEVIVKNDENYKRGRPAADYDISVDMAKQICMIQRTPEGKEIRQYFIDLEKTWNTPEQVFARALKMADRTIAELHNKVEIMKPDAVLGKAITTADTTILIWDLAKILKQNGIDIGGKRLFEWMREHGYLIKRKGTDWNLPTQRSVDQGLFVIKESVYMGDDGCNKITRTPKVTGKGQQYFINKFLGQQSEGGTWE